MLLFQVIECWSSFSTQWKWTSSSTLWPVRSRCCPSSCQVKHAWLTHVHCPASGPTSYAHTLLSFPSNLISPCSSWSDVNSGTKRKPLLALWLRDQLAKTDFRYPISPVSIPLHTKKKPPCNFLVTWMPGPRLVSFQDSRAPGMPHGVPSILSVPVWPSWEGAHLPLEGLPSSLEMSSSLG